MKKREKYDGRGERGGSGGERSNTQGSNFHPDTDHLKASMIFFCYSTKILGQNFNM